MILLLAGCTSNKQPPKNQPAATSLHATWQPPEAGSEVAQIKERIKEDKLNEKYFRVSVTTTDSSAKGYYLLTLNYAFSENKTVIAFPQWTNGAFPKPVLQNGSEHYQALLGFDVGDGNFHPYYEITVQDHALSLKQTNDYVLSTP